MKTRDGSTSGRSEAESSLRSLHPEGEGSGWGWLIAIEAWPVVRTSAAVAAALAAVAAVQVLTGWDYVAPLYLLPLALAAWRLGRVPALAWAVITAGLWLAANLTATSATGSPWAVLSWLAVFAAFGLLTDALRSQRGVVRELDGTDRLTGVHDGASFRALVELERNRTLRYNRPFTLAYVDVDGLREVNRALGHAAGDAALRLAAAAIRDSIRSVDSLGRVAGDEFALLFPETGQEVADTALRKIRARLTEVMAERALGLTCTIGGVICVGAPESVDELIQRAEGLMYAAKERPDTWLLTEVLDENYGIAAILQRS